MDSSWAKGFPKNQKYVTSLYDQGVGYYRLNEWPSGMYAFRRAHDEPLPEHLENCTDNEVKRLEKKREQREQMLRVRDK